MALLIIAVTAAFALALGLRAGRGRDLSLEQWSVGGRGFGSLLVFLLMAGETYTTFTFLGGVGWAYGKGGPALYILVYLTIGFILSYWMLPPLWAYAKEHRLLAQPDYFAHRYRSPVLGIVVALVGVTALVPYLVLQFKGLGIIVATASGGAIGAETAIWIGATIVTGYVIVSGVHGSAWTATIKDAAILGVVVFLGIYLPLHYYGGIGEMFRAVDAARPGFLTLPPRGLSMAWFESTVILNGLGAFMWPHGFASVFTARNPDTFRRNAALLPLYQLLILFVFLIGFAAILQVPGLRGADSDLALLRIAQVTFPSWFLGVIGAAGLLTALVPGSVILMSAATLIANNLYAPLTGARRDGRGLALLARGAVPVVSLVAVGFTLRGGSAIVSLLLMGYNIVTQLFPSFIWTLSRRNPLNAAGALAGIATGIGIVAWTTLTGVRIATLLPGAPGWVQDLNIGMVALVANAAVALAVSALTARRQPALVRAKGV